MTAGAPWSVKGIDPKAREVAKDLARRSGMTLGEWLNRMILEDDPDDAVSKALFGDRPPRQQRPAIEIPPRAAAPASPSPYYDPPARTAAPHSREDIARVALALDRLTDHIEASETRAGLAISGVEQSVRAALARLDGAERQQAVALQRMEGALEDIRGEQVRAAERLRKMEQEASGPRSAEALKALEAALGKVAARLDHKDDRTQDLLSAVEGRIQRLEGGEATPSAVVEDSFGKLAERLAQAESRTAEALEGMRESFAALEGRLRSVETGELIDKRLEGLAAGLGQRLDEARVEIAAQLTASAEDRFDRMERKLGEMAGTVQAAEQRSAEAIEKMGLELAGVAKSLTQRVEAAEAGSAKAIDLVGAEMARIGESVEARLARSDSVQAEALGKLSSEITRISERLTERISNAERRSAQAIDDVGEQVARVSERIGQRAEKASDELADRIRASEERTARLLEEAREKIDQRLAEAQTRLSEQVKAAVPPPPAAPEPVLPPPEAFDGSVGAEPEPPARGAPPPPRNFAVKPMFAAAFPPAARAAPPEPAEPEFDETDFEAADGFVPAAAAAADGLAAPTLASDAGEARSPADELDPLAEVMKAIAAAPSPAAEPPAGAGSDADAELLKPPALEPAPAFDAPAAAEPDAFAPELDDPFAAAAAQPGDEAPSAASAEAEPAEGGAEAPDDLFDEPAAPVAAPERPLTARELIEQARAAARQAAHDPRAARKSSARESSEAGGLFSGFSVAKPKRAGRTLPTALLVVGGVAAASLSIGGLVVMSEDMDGPSQVAQGEPSPADALPGAPRAAVALAPKKLTPQPAPAQPDANVELLYGQAVQEVEAGAPEGLDKLRKAANLGHAPAQFYLAKLYEAGRGGLKQDLAEARKWTERAAQNGDRKAMHNLALYYFEGTGGPKNTTTAAQWFQRAAEMGLTDSQYNLGRLYEEGVGVPQNAAEAYRWYLIAARSGDGESRASAQRVRGQLTAEARVVAEKSAGAFRAAAPAKVALGADKAAVATAQRALERLGYYQLQGPADGVPSPALRMAIAAYQRDQELPATGELDSLTVSRLAVFTR